MKSLLGRIVRGCRFFHLLGEARHLFTIFEAIRCGVIPTVYRGHHVHRRLQYLIPSMVFCSVQGGADQYRYSPSPQDPGAAPPEARFPSSTLISTLFPTIRF